MLSNYNHISVLIFMLVAALIGGSSACPSGCICRGRPEQRDTAVCYKPWPHRNKAVEFDEPITSLEFRHLLYQDILPFLSAARQVSNVVIYPSKKSPRDDPLPDDLFNGMEKLEVLTIHRTTDGLAPAGLGKAIKLLPRLKTLALVGNTLQCDCTLPKAIAAQKVLLPSQSRMPVVKGCKHHGFASDLYSVHDFLKKCAEHGGYKLPELSAKEVAHQAQAQAGFVHRKFGNIKDKSLFKSGIKYTRINENREKPSAAKAVPKAFSGALGKPPSGDMLRRGPGEKRVLLPGAISGRARSPPAISASAFGNRFSKARHHVRKWGRRRLLSFDEEDGSEPAHSEAIFTLPSEETRWRRQASNQGVPQRVPQRVPRKRKPVKMSPGMTMDEFINAHLKRRSGKRRRKRKNGWTGLSGGWRYREVRSADAENISDTDLSGGMFTTPSQGMQQSLETGNQEAPPRSKRRAGEENSNLGDEVNRTNRTEHPLTEDAPNQRLNDNNDRQTLNQNLEGNLGVSPGAAQSNPPGEVNPHRRPAGGERDHDHPHRYMPAERAHQLAVYKLPVNDLTLKLNPFDPFEVDLFFQYILHNENLRERQESSHPHP